MWAWLNFASLWTNSNLEVHKMYIAEQPCTPTSESLRLLESLFSWDSWFWNNKNCCQYRSALPHTVCSLFHTHSHLYTCWQKHTHALWNFCCCDALNYTVHIPVFWTLKNNWILRNRILLLVSAPFVNNKDTRTVLELCHSTDQPAFSKAPRMKNGFWAFTFLCCSVSRWARTSVKFLKAVTPHHPQPLVTCITRFCKLPKQNGRSVMYAIVAFVFHWANGERPKKGRWHAASKKRVLPITVTYRSLQCKWQKIYNIQNTTSNGKIQDYGTLLNINKLAL